MSDTELDSQFVPTGRPQSQMARSFALALDDLFKLDSSEDLDAIVTEKKNEISTKTSELEELEARLKATEERLKAKQAAVSPGSSPPGKSTFQQQRSTTNPISPLEPKFGNDVASRGAEVSGEDLASRPAAPKQDQSYTTALASSIPGALPPTPGASEGEYELDDGERTSADYVIVTKDGDVPPAVTE
ncbi:hypothetical protein SBOR_7542 [Sclerotinia borealis F-4128]|uniref:Uncharacterized protein n=1 Tax=Sclerotinia borealis (strain F-4128) TaxID=1432307 RepID=W9CBY5_SCLBF|nr:hypothetical protein SBOR_7542 [Sclerotinia borealis F-4128]